MVYAEILRTRAVTCLPGSRVKITQAQLRHLGDAAREIQPPEEPANAEASEGNGAGPPPELPDAEKSGRGRRKKGS